MRDGSGVDEVECLLTLTSVMAKRYEHPLCFFFQAEDGIRDLTVTGVQTCALPISAACGRCHGPIFERWKRTRMANVVRDPREHPEAIIGDFTQPNPLLTFTKDQIAFVDRKSVV